MTKSEKLKFLFKVIKRITDKNFQNTSINILINEAWIVENLLFIEIHHDEITFTHIHNKQQTNLYFEIRKIKNLTFFKDN